MSPLTSQRRILLLENIGKKRKSHGNLLRTLNENRRRRKQCVAVYNWTSVISALLFTVQGKNDDGVLLYLRSEIRGLEAASEIMRICVA